MSRRVLLGKWPSGIGSGIGLRVAKAGFDANTATDDQLVFSSDWPAVLPILVKGTAIVDGGTTVNPTFPDPGYIPFAFFMVRPWGAPYGSPAYQPVMSDSWQSTVAFPSYSDTGQSYIGLQALQGYLSLDYGLATPGGNTIGWPASIQVGYVVYWLQANT